MTHDIINDYNQSVTKLTIAFPESEDYYFSVQLDTDRHPGSPLTETWRVYINNLSDKMKHLGWSERYSSPLPATLEMINRKKA